MTLTSILSRTAMLAAVAPFFVMLFDASQDWLAAYADRNNPQAAKAKSEVVSRLNDEEMMALDRTMMKQEAVDDLLDGLDTPRQTLERFRAINLGLTRGHNEFPTNEFRDSMIAQILSYASIRSSGDRKHKPMISYEELKCECFYLDSLSE
ncbi:hypothetical protein [Zavarzinella formosa]|uniref:hypothetical protein n=1 Tax=Zavarzinella formosa TaxID=360055 RepID=UPI00030D2D8D|nr:hypothetical protein [Zavarzinella formosa]